MQKSKRKLRLETETLRQLTTDRLGEVHAGYVVGHTLQNSTCNGKSCDLSCAGAC